MVIDLQKASLWKRFAAWLFDGIITSILAVGFGFLLALVLNYNTYSETLDQEYIRYENQYNVTFDITQEAYMALSDADKQAYDTAYEALIADENVLTAYNMVVSLSLVVVSVGLLLAVVVLEVVLPLIFGNGQSLGKRIFSLGVIRTDAVQINKMQVFARAILGKYTIEIMIPVYTIILIFFSGVGIMGTLLLFGLFIAQCIIICVTRTNSLIHDLLAGTVVVDISSQQTFKDTDEMIEYTKRIHAEKSAQQRY